MPENVSELKPLKGLSRLLFRLPIWFYRAHLGWLMGTRFVLLSHTGRKSGQERRNVLEVVRYDPKDGSCYVASGWGEKSDWFKNISVNPLIKFQIRTLLRRGQAVRLSAAEAGRELADYNRRHPRAMQELARFMGYRVNGTEEDLMAMGAMIPLFHFVPVDE